MQKLEIIGRIGNDAEVKDLNQNQVINFSVAVSESYTNKSGEKVTNTTWFECAKWGNSTTIAQYIKKGGQIFVSGKVNNRAYAKDDGTIQVINGINVFEIELLGSKQDSDSNVANPPKAERPQSNMPNSFVDDFKEDESDLPF